MSHHACPRFGFTRTPTTRQAHDYQPRAYTYSLEELIPIQNDTVPVVDVVGAIGLMLPCIPAVEPCMSRSTDSDAFIDWVAISKARHVLCEFKLCMSRYIIFIAGELLHEARLHRDDPLMFPLVDAHGLGFAETSLDCAFSLFSEFEGFVKPTLSAELIEYDSGPDD